MDTQQQRKYSVSIWILIILFILFSIAVRTGVFTTFDYSSTVWLQEHISTRWDTFFSLFSVMGTVEATSIVLLIIVLCYRTRNSLYIIGSYAVILLIELFGKYVIPHPGPPQMLARYKVFFTYPSAYLLQPPSSYPSGHAGRTMLLSGVLFFLLYRSKRFNPTPKWILSFLIVLYDAILLVSRVDLGEHWTTDVIGGTMLGLAFGLYNGVRILNETHKKPKPH